MIDNKSVCFLCKGTGKIKVKKRSGAVEETCPRCQGSGRGGLVKK